MFRAQKKCLRCFDVDSMDWRSVGNILVFEEELKAGGFTVYTLRPEGQIRLKLLHCIDFEISLEVGPELFSARVDRSCRL